MIAQWRRWGVCGVMVIMALGCVLGLAFFARPSTSDYEKRTLTTFPAITLETFLDGTFTSEVSLWYADTFPFRDQLVQASRSLQNLYGVQPQTQMVGGNVQADELPPIDSASSASATSSDSAASEPEKREHVEQPEAQVMQEGIQDHIMQGLYVDGDRACSVYYFSEDAVRTYTDALNACADALDGVATVYSVLIPNNSGALLDEDVLAQLGGTDQKQALDYFHSLMNEKVKVVETYDALRAHRDEYIYFRTDHHWTQLGAYYAYQQLCEKAGMKASDISTWEHREYAPFLGSFYGELMLPAMEANPDTVHAYVPTGTNDMTYWDQYGTETKGHVIEDAEIYGDTGKYLCFIEGDQPLEKIENPTINDGSSCLVVKDSYGCAFVPLLVDNYQTVWVLDFRYYTDSSIPEFVREHDVKDVIFMNNMTIAGTDTAAQGLLALSQE